MIICRECNLERHEYPERWWIGTKPGLCGLCQEVKTEAINVITAAEALEAALRGKGER